MVEPDAPSGWVVASGPPRNRRRWIGGCLIALVVVVVLVVGAVLAVAQSSFGHGLGAAFAIYDHGKPQVYRANYAEFTGRPPTMDVYLAVGVDPALASTIGCGVVRRELAAAGLSGVRWVVHAASGEPVADSTTVTCF